MSKEVLSRRAMLLFAGGGLAAWTRLYASGSDFWDKKPPAEWTSDEVDKLVTRSPWAKEVNAEYAPGEGDSAPASRGGGYPGSGRTGGGIPGGTGGPRIGMGGPRIPGIGIPGIPGGGNRGGGGQRHGGPSSYKAVVRWESARPILDAMKTTLPEAFAGHYVISVSGVPLFGSRSEDEEENPQRMLDNLKSFTILRPKGKELVEAGIVQQQPSSGSSFLFGFSKEMLPLTSEDKEVLFSTRLGRLTVKAKFSPREMLYHGQLAL